VLTVSDDGRGGARISDGHGLAGLRERVDGLRGTLTVDSPVGGPTTVVVVLPLVWSLEGEADAIVTR
jgi:signal transduction histidine kinase